MKDYTSYLKNDTLSIFLFHGVIPDTKQYKVRNYNKKHIHESYFRDILKSLLRFGTAISIEDIANNHTKSAATNPFIISFDDGFKNNKTIAAPILEELGIPAVFYVTTGFVEYNGMSWIDKIEWLFENIEGEHRIAVQENEKVIINMDSASKISALELIRKHVKQSKQLDVNSYVSDLFSQLGKDVVPSSLDVLDEKMNWKDVIDLNSSDLFTIGGHTHSHAIMSYLSDKDLVREVDMSLSLIQKHLGATPEHYSYPEGQREHYNQHVISLLKSRGITCCPSAVAGVNTYPLDVFNLNRVMVI